MSEEKKPSTLLEYLQEHPFVGPFKPVPHYFRDGDFLNWYWSDERCWAEQINHEGRNVGTVYRSFKDGRVVGVKIESIKALTAVPPDQVPKLEPLPYPLPPEDEE